MNAIHNTFVMTAALLNTAANAQFTDDIVKIGVLTDVSGVHSDIGGPSSVASAMIGGPSIAATENPVNVFRVIIVVRGIGSDWNETFVVNPEYPSFEMCEGARGNLVEDFLYILKKRYLQPFNVDSKCVRSDGDAAA